MYVSPSSGDCDTGLDQSSPVMVSRRSLFRWQHPEVIENANRHEPEGLTHSANGSRANRADEQNSGRASGAMRKHRRGRACHSLITLCVASEPPVKATLRLACSLRSQRSALTGPGSDARADFRDEGMAGLVHSARGQPCQQFSLDTDRPSHGSPVRQHWEPLARPLAPERGVRIRARSHLSPRSGAGQLATWTRASRPELSSFALWALLEVRWLRLAALCPGAA